MKLLRTMLPAGLVVATALIAWFWATPGVVPELVFPSPESVWQAIESLGWALAWHSFVTLVRVLLGWALGSVLGIGFGLALTWSARVFRACYPLVEFLRPLPPTALIPFFIVWFGLGISGQLVLVGIGCFMVLTVSTYEAVHNTPERYPLAAASLGATKWAIYRSVFFPSIIPSLVPALRVSAALAFAVAVAAELMGAQSGLGFLMMVARRTLHTNTILVGIMIIAVQSFCLDLAIRAAGAWGTRWADRSRETIARLH